MFNFIYRYFNVKYKLFVMFGTSLHKYKPNKILDLKTTKNIEIQNDWLVYIVTQISSSISYVQGQEHRNSSLASKFEFGKRKKGTQKQWQKNKKKNISSSNNNNDSFKRVHMNLIEMRLLEVDHFFSQFQSAFSQK